MRFCRAWVHRFSIIKNVEIKSIEDNDFLPYFILTDKAMMMFDPEFNNGVFIDDENIIKVYTGKFMSLYEKGEKVIVSFQMPLSL